MNYLTTTYTFRNGVTGTYVLQQNPQQPIALAMYDHEMTDELADEIVMEFMQKCIPYLVYKCSDLFYETEHPAPCSNAMLPVAAAPQNPC